MGWDWVGSLSAIMQEYLIFVTSTTSGAHGEKICHVEKFLHMTYCHLERFSTWQIVMWKHFSTWEMWRKSVIWRNNVYNLWCFETCFGTIYAILLGDKLSQRLNPWRENDKYEVCYSHLSHSINCVECFEVLLSESMVLQIWIYFSKYYRPLGSWSALI